MGGRRRLLLLLRASDVPAIAAGCLATVTADFAFYSSSRRPSFFAVFLVLLLLRPPPPPPVMRDTRFPVVYDVHRTIENLFNYLISVFRGVNESKGYITKEDNIIPIAFCTNLFQPIFELVEQFYLAPRKYNT